MADTFTGGGMPIEEGDFTDACHALGVNAACLWSVLAVETRGFGFLPDRRPKLLFERHIFRGRTDGRFDKANPDLSNRKPGGYSGGVGEYDRLKRAMVLDSSAALESASWGLGQIMGFNAKAIGYADAGAMVADFVKSEGNQLAGCAKFISATAGLANALANQHWDTFARAYNGKDYKKNDYANKLRTSYQSFAAGPLPDLKLRAAQAWLTYLGFHIGAIDGVLGSHTAKGLRAFQQQEGLASTGMLDQTTYDSLKRKAG